MVQGMLFHGAGESLTPAEIHVRDSLTAYRFDSESVDACEVVPTRVLYAAYLRFVEAVGGSPLNPTQFGITLRRVFGIGQSWKVAFRLNGKKEWGYRHVRGPQSVQMHPTRGNPNFRKQLRRAA